MTQRVDARPKLGDVDGSDRAHAGQQGVIGEWRVDREASGPGDSEGWLAVIRDDDRQRVAARVRGARPQAKDSCSAMVVDERGERRQADAFELENVAVRIGRRSGRCPLPARDEWSYRRSRSAPAGR